ncbi:hypothetical protein TNIN_147271 [Trichonephila inaurata madagascariensis]|uniref:Uncharacterized protein n=1 Tax=Trichonephila inaurata madagascariensis TaxID=2747483 RepID=A0A8X7CQS8_9ARAC|nr:hypothetical protein TNIN_147271 [Trichonephila inaurata madagascariensis]
MSVGKLTHLHYTDGRKHFGNQQGILWCIWSFRNQIMKTRSEKSLKRKAPRCQENVSILKDISSGKGATQSKEVTNISTAGIMKESIMPAQKVKAQVEMKESIIPAQKVKAPVEMKEFIIPAKKVKALAEKMESIIPAKNVEAPVEMKESIIPAMKVKAPAEKIESIPAKKVKAPAIKIEETTIPAKKVKEEMADNFEKMKKLSLLMGPNFIQSLMWLRYIARSCNLNVKEENFDFNPSLFAPRPPIGVPRQKVPKYRRF